MELYESIQSVKAEIPLAALLLYILIVDSKHGMSHYDLLLSTNFKPLPTINSLSKPKKRNELSLFLSLLPSGLPYINGDDIYTYIYLNFLFKIFQFSSFVQVIWKKNILFLLEYSNSRWYSS